MAAAGKGKKPPQTVEQKRAAARERQRRARAKAKPAEPTAAEREQAKAMIASVTPIKRPDGRGRTRNKYSRPGSPEAAALAARRTRALNLRRLGLQWAQVASKVLEEPQFAAMAPSYSAADAYHDARALIDSVTVESVQAVREDDLAILLSLQRVAYPKALEGDPKMLRAMMEILDRRSRYLGLDAPMRVQLPSEATLGNADLDSGDDAAVYAAALAALDATLPHLDPIELPGTGGA